MGLQPFVSNPSDVNDCFANGLLSILFLDYRVEKFTDYILENYRFESSQYSLEMLGINVFMYLY